MYKCLPYGVKYNIFLINMTAYMVTIIHVKYTKVIDTELTP